MRNSLIISLLLSALITLGASDSAFAQNLKATGDTLTSLLRERTRVKGRVTVTGVKESKKGLTVTCAATLKDFPWDGEQLEWFKDQLSEFLPKKYKGKKILAVKAAGTDIKTLFDYPEKRKYRDSREPFIEQVDGTQYNRGLSGRNIAIWQSHGLYFDDKSDRWRFQRANVFTTVEDLYTQSYVVEFLIPMLENAGAYILDPRERSPQREEIICDNDPSFQGDRPAGVRLGGSFRMEGDWTQEAEGFADTVMFYIPGENPFFAGTSLKAPMQKGRTATATATWSFEVPSDGEYPVYLAYRTFPNSTKNARYTVNAADGPTEFILDQTECGQMWTYLGTFQFLKGHEYSVVLDNSTPQGRKYDKNSVVSADAVRIGGGMGKILRGKEGLPREMLRTSGQSSFVEGALYSMLWGGCDPQLLRWEGDYTNDYAGRGVWTKTRNIPVDLSLAFHTDAGTTSDDSIIGTLAIYTYKDDGGVTRYKDGNDRIQGRHLTELIQNEVVADLRSSFEPDWNRRFLWDRSYSESRTTGVPGMLMELLSHQNFADMRLGLDPTFRFTACRAVYKGMVKFLSEYYGGLPYVIQPLPVNSFSVSIDGDEAILEWKETIDEKEESATADRFLVQVREEDGVWGKAIPVKTQKKDDWYRARLPLKKGILNSFRVYAENKGGKSFPSEVLCAGVPADDEECAKPVLIVNNFTRLAAPAWHDYGDEAGFDVDVEMGVGYGTEYLFIGPQHEFRRNAKYETDDYCGWGASMKGYAGKPVTGNTFDYVSRHAAAVLAAGRAVCSASVDAYSAGRCAPRPLAIDLLCGKQTATPVGRGVMPDRYMLLPDELQEALRLSTSQGTGIIISGAYLSREFTSGLYDNSRKDFVLSAQDSTYRAEGLQFCKNVLGYAPGFDRPYYEPKIFLSDSKLGWAGQRSIAFNTKPGPSLYPVQGAVSLKHTGTNTKVLATFDSDFPAAMGGEMKGYKTVCFSIPLETILFQEDLNKAMDEALNFIIKQ